MAFGSLDSHDDNAPLAEINMVPLIDVMLVLLIIFMVTAPLLTHSVQVDLPRASSSPTPQRAEHVDITLDGEGRLFWNGKPLAAGELDARLASAAAEQPQPDLHIRAARTTPYEEVARLMSDAARNGLSRIGFVTEPVRPVQP